MQLPTKNYSSKGLRSDVALIDVYFDLLILYGMLYWLPLISGGFQSSYKAIGWISMESRS